MNYLNFDSYNQVKTSMKDKFPILLERYHVDGKKYISIIQDALVQSDLDTIINNAHNIKSSSGLIGFVMVHEHAKNLEYSGKSMVNEALDVETLEIHFNKLVKAFNEAEEFVIDQLDDFK
ncbi:MAG: hypothetical protein CMP22_03240 [Rickettsiales bacterium]|nr:hypothetical protein [Rickettsiales bacterium]|tara:strand:- start:545 stop:904 length:360 start_codon:yes stop_codon:yes gene_type:complete